MLSPETSENIENVSGGFCADYLTVWENDSDLPGAGAPSPSRFRPLPPPYRTKSTMSGASTVFIDRRRRQVDRSFVLWGRNRIFNSASPFRRMTSLTIPPAAGVLSFFPIRAA